MRKGYSKISPIMMKILIIIEAGKIYPSGLVRGLIYKDLFKKYGYRYKYLNRNSPTLLNLAARPPWILRFMNPKWIASIALRLNAVYNMFMEKYILFISDRYDVVYASKLFDLDLVYRLKTKKNRRIVFDFTDAFWQYRSGGRYTAILMLADAVTTDNIYTARYIKKYNSNCFIIPDYPQLDVFDKYRNRQKKQNKKIIIGWIGSPSTLYNMSLIWDTMHYLFVKYKNIRLRLVGVGNNSGIFPNILNYIDCSTRYAYDQKRMVEEVLNMDIGLFPLQDIEASLSRGILKASIYMCGSVPVVASPIGELNDFIRDGHNGFLAKDPDEWKRKLELLINDKGLRETIGKNGLDTARKAFSLEDNFNRLTKIFEGIPV